jgi:hypothetical protein
MEGIPLFVLADVKQSFIINESVIATGFANSCASLPHPQDTTDILCELSSQVAYCFKVYSQRPMISSIVEITVAIT